MMRAEGNRAGRRTTAWLLHAAAISLALLVGSCQRGPRSPVEPAQAEPAVPVVRVLTTPESLERALVSSSGGYRLWLDGGLLSESATPLANAAVSRLDDRWRINLLSERGRELVLEPMGDGSLRLGSTSYRGRLHLLPAEGSRFIVVNRLDMEQYLAGVLARELYPAWDAETYRAQAIAARTFAMYHVMTFGRNNAYDLGSTTAAQVYGGLSAESDKSRRAVAQTRGRVLAFGPKGQERIFMAQYSACCGGRVNSARVLRQMDEIGPFRGGQECRDCASCPRYRWPTVRVSKADLHAAMVASMPKLADLAAVAELRPAGSPAAGGRVVWVDVVAPDGRSVRVRAEDIRLALLRAKLPAGKGLNSMNCRIIDVGDAMEFADGHGFGHGVGLCQWGAQGKASRGWRAEEILGFYYPGAVIIRAY